MAEGTSLMRAGGGVNAIVPQSFEEAWRVAGALAASGLAPKDLATQEKVLAVIMAGAEIGMPPFQALQSFAVINGRPALWGDGMLGVVRKFGVTVEERLEGAGDTAVAFCVVTRPDTKERIERQFSVADAKTAKLWGKRGSSGQDTPWITYPMRMLQMRARAWALRDGCADMLRGMKMAEEVQDFEVIADEPLPFIEGADKDRIVAAWRVRLEQATTPEEIDAVNTEIADMRNSKRMASNPLDGIEAISVQQYERVCEGIPPEPPVPNPFEGLKAEALACVQMEDKAAGLAALLAWKSKLTKERLSRCEPEEKNELNRLFSNCKKTFLEPAARA